MIGYFLLTYAQLKGLDLFVCWVYEKIFGVKEVERFPYRKITQVI